MSPKLGFVMLLAAFALFAAGCASVADPQGWAGPELAGETMYASIEKGKMAALDPADLTPRWVFPSSDDEDQFDLEGIYGAPIVNEGLVYFGAYDGTVYAVDAEAGFLVWAFETADPIVNSLALREGTLFAGSTDGVLYAINAENGEEIDRFDTGSSIWGSPLLLENTLYVPAMNGRLYALDATSLEPVSGFSFETDAGLLMDPTPAGEGTLFVGGIDSKLFAIEATTGEEKWSFEGGNWFWGSPLVEGETVYVPDLDGNVYALGVTDGSPIWSDAFKAAAPVRSAPLLTGDKLIIVDRRGNVYGRNPDDGTAVSGWPTNPNTDEPSVPLDKAVLSDPFLLEPTNSPRATGASPSASPGAESPSPTGEASPAGEDRGGAELIIIAQGGDLCRLDPADGTPITTPTCIEVPV